MQQSCKVCLDNACSKASMWPCLTLAAVCWPVSPELNCSRTWLLSCRVLPAAPAMLLHRLHAAGTPAPLIVSQDSTFACQK